MNSVHLNFINRSNDVNNSQIVIFQKNVATDFDEDPVAWKVIQNCGPGENHPFDYPFTMEINSKDSWGNHTPRQTAVPGQRFHVTRESSGDSLSFEGPATSPLEVQMANDLEQGSVSANIYKDNRLLATKSVVVPGQNAVFEFKPTIFIGVASEIVEGELMNSAIVSGINCEFSLLGIASADIIMTGGGAGASSTPFKFILDNVRMA